MCATLATLQRRILTLANHPPRTVVDAVGGVMRVLDL